MTALKLAEPTSSPQGKAPSGSHMCSVVPVPSSMKAVVQTGYGSPDVLQLVERPVPTPKPDEVLVRIHRAGINTADSMLRQGTPRYARLFLGLFKPRHPIPGTGFSGVVQAVGSDVTKFDVGDAVFGEPGLNFGAHAEYVAVAESGMILRKPDAVSFEDAAVLCDGPMTSLNFLQRLTTVQPGQHVAIIGASGSLGTVAVQIAKHMGAHVTGICSAPNAALVRDLGADVVVDYKTDDFTRGDQTYDIIYDTVAARPFGECKRALKSGGSYISPVLSMGLLFRMMWTSVFGSKHARFDATGMRKPEELRAFVETALSLMSSGDMRIVHQDSFELGQIRDAYAIVDSGRKVGNVTLAAI